jgi:uncharacterized membrane protein (DUF485 family)
MTSESHKKPDLTDLTPSVGAETDVAPLGRTKVKPAHEQTADEDTDAVAWERVAEMEEFKKLVSSKLRFIIPATLFFVFYYFALPVLVGYTPQWMKQEVIGRVNLAYLFALSQFFMAWFLAALYMRAASQFDETAKEILKKAGRHKGQ